jgi:hypothetical protein
MHFRRRSFKFKTTGASIETVLWNWFLTQAVTVTLLNVTNLTVTYSVVTCLILTCMMGRHGQLRDIKGCTNGVDWSTRWSGLSKAAQ